MSKRTQIMAALKTAFGVIPSLSVYEWRTSKIPKEGAPVLIMRDTNADAAESYGSTMHGQTVELEMVAVGKAAAVQIREVVGPAVLAAIGADVTLGGLAEDIEFSGSEMAVDAGDVIAAGLRLEIKINYITPQWEI